MIVAINHLSLSVYIDKLITDNLTFVFKEIQIAL